MQRIVLAFTFSFKQETVDPMENSYVCSKHFEPDCFTKSLGGQWSRLKSGSVPTKFIFMVESPERKKPRNRETNTNIGAAKRMTREDFDRMNAEAKEPGANIGSAVVENQVLKEHVRKETDVAVKLWDDENEQLKQLKLKDDEILHITL